MKLLLFKFRWFILVQASSFTHAISQKVIKIIKKILIRITDKHSPIAYKVGSAGNMPYPNEKYHEKCKIKTKYSRDYLQFMDK